MPKIAVMLFGAPGSGKGTQADLLAKKTGLLHFDTGKYLEQYLFDPRNQKDPIVKRERDHFVKGILTTPSFVLTIVKEKVREIAEADFGVVFSGSPRTLEEAKGLLPLMEKLYGRKNIFPFLIRVKPESSFHRNSNRKVCSFCATPVMAKHKLDSCPLCGAPLKTRSVDDPKVIPTRLKEYKERTEPIFAYLEDRGYVIPHIHGEPLPFRVYQNIHKRIHGNQKKR